MPGVTEAKATYVIRESQFGYNDECYYVSGSRIRSIYQDEQEAQERYRALEVAQARNAYLCEHEKLWDMDEKSLQELDLFVIEKTGQSILSDGQLEDFPPNMDDDDIYEFVKRAGIEAYRLVEFKETPFFYALWNAKEECYQMDYDECFTGLSYSESIDGVMKNLQYFIEDNDWDNILVIEGDIQHISNSSILLKQLILNTKGLSYCDASKKLTARRMNVGELAALNELLVDPFYEVRKLSIDEVLSIEKELEEESCEW
ncbi:hypothetical protein [Pleionea sp. CnH1-48]|uniref:hypothetical protein n=1 Tax=Pleionea sp. CnH1-48 TaxID=2954494 RepID=UPI002097FCED|nr:hypothetical protein [Pleionea sp. CnH1-48]MCO7224052.1 hypothetical protein [Pleionea sp. CnH1-48]